MEIGGGFSVGVLVSFLGGLFGGLFCRSRFFILGVVARLRGGKRFVGAGFSGTAEGSLVFCVKRLGIVEVVFV